VNTTDSINSQAPSQSSQPSSTADFSVNTTDLFNNEMPSQSPQTSTTEISGATNAFIIPSALNTDIEESCANDKAMFLISTGDPLARSKCIKACQNGICCFTTQLGYEWMDSCYNQNIEVCAEYSACLILQDTSQQDLPVQTNTTAVDMDTSDNVTSNYTDNDEGNVEDPAQNIIAAANETAVIVTLDGPPTPDQDLSLLCSEDNITQISGLKKCIKACDLGNCCSSTDETECLTTHNEICYLYTPCNNAYNLLYSD
jgi:hypothetical protein